MTKEFRYKAVALGPVRTVSIMVRNLLIRLRHLYLRRGYGMDIHPTCRFSLKANLDRTNPRGLHIGAETYVAFGAAILTHDMCRQFHADTRIGQRCFIGAHAIVLPGVVIGDECIVGAGAVVTQDIPSNSMVAGNPARIVRQGIRTTAMGKLVEDKT